MTQAPYSTPAYGQQASIAATARERTSLESDTLIATAFGRVSLAGELVAYQARSQIPSTSFAVAAVKQSMLNAT